jgi:hypothetical protein
MDVVPADALSGLTAEDLLLILNGSPALDLTLLRKCTSYVDESGRSNLNATEKMRSWFWSVVQNMSVSQR